MECHTGCSNPHREKSQSNRVRNVENFIRACRGGCGGTHGCGTSGVLSGLIRTIILPTLSPDGPCYGIWHGKINEHVSRAGGWCGCMCT